MSIDEPSVESPDDEKSQGARAKLVKILVLFGLPLFAMAFVSWSILQIVASFKSNYPSSGQNFGPITKQQFKFAWDIIFAKADGVDVPTYLAALLALFIPILTVVDSHGGLVGGDKENPGREWLTRLATITSFVTGVLAFPYVFQIRYAMDGHFVGGGFLALVVFVMAAGAIQIIPVVESNAQKVWRERGQPDAVENLRKWQADHENSAVDEHPGYGRLAVTVVITSVLCTVAPLVRVIHGPVKGSKVSLFAVSFGYPLVFLVFFLAVALWAYATNIAMRIAYPRENFGALKRAARSVASFVIVAMWLLLLGAVALAIPCSQWTWWQGVYLGVLAGCPLLLVGFCYVSFWGARRNTRSISGQVGRLLGLNQALAKSRLCAVRSLDKSLSWGTVKDATPDSVSA